MGQHKFMIKQKMKEKIMKEAINFILIKFHPLKKLNKNKNNEIST